MIITDKREDSSIRFEYLKFGDWFYYEKCLCCKIDCGDHPRYNCVNIESSDLIYVDDRDVVIPVSVEIVVTNP